MDGSLGLDGDAVGCEVVEGLGQNSTVDALALEDAVGETSPESRSAADHQIIHTLQLRSPLRQLVQRNCDRIVNHSRRVLGSSSHVQLLYDRQLLEFGETQDLGLVEGFLPLRDWEVVIAADVEIADA
jgi:hypothetical protein